ncbi:hypothetical protein F4781DRAFT_383211 [Annulohypoxylon bovei var. microspora]|nr:hypothetical protein F4781DRAFT_383211 [Annulohypoxylon bovei var. microspora]
MTDAPGSDRSLLDRLNALKPSTVNLDPSSKTIAASTIEPAKPLSREDALSERLKSLRNQPSNKVHPTYGSGVDDEGGSIVTAPLNLTSQPQTKPKSPDANISAPEISSAEEVDDDADPLLYTDDQTLEELLADLQSDQAWLDEVVAEEEEHRRVTALLDELGKASSDKEGPDDTTEPKTGHDDGDEENSDDDSDGERMTHEADDILAQAADEAGLEKANEPPSQPDPTPTSTNDINLPRDQESDHTDPFNLPTVPSSLQDQPVPPDPAVSQDDADFAASINSRMAALNLGTSPSPNLPSAPTSAVDAFGLPAAPTFTPADRPAPGLAKRAGYTDADQKTWCVVCLEDGAVQCAGCDGDVYCARCWREMHVGPSAGYDERGHRWEKFVKGR